MTDHERRLLQRVDDARGDLLEWTRELVAIPTVNPYSGDSSAGSEAPGQDWIAHRLWDLGGDVWRIPVPPDVYERGGIIGPAGRSWKSRENVVAAWEVGSGTGPTILLNDHMDTVGTDGMTVAPFDPVVDGDRVSGRGTSDTKGNMVAGLIAVRELLADADGLNGRIVFESVVDEECNGGGAGTLACCLAGVTGDFAICLDGMAGTLYNGCGGVLTAGLTVRGKAGHAARGGAVNAIDKAIVAKTAGVDAFVAAHKQAFPECFVNIGVFRAGTLAAIVPGRAHMEMNITYAVADAQEASERYGHWDGRVCRERYEAAILALADVDEWFRETPARIEWIKDLYPYLCDETEARMELASAAASDVLGAPARVEPMQAWCDGSHLARQLGIPVIGMGHGADGAPHSPDEYANISDLVRGAKTVALTLRRLLS